MLHTLAHASHMPARRQPQEQQHLDPSRIAALSGALTINAAALLLLLMPIAAPPPMPVQDTTITVVPLPMKPKPVETVPVRVPVVLPQVRRNTDVRPRPAVAPVQEQVIVAAGTEAVMPTPDLDAGPATLAPIPLAAAVRLEYASAPPPPYPRGAWRDGIEGTVLLRVLVDIDGKPLEVSIARSSGHRQLDEAARRQVLHRWTFRPATADGRAVQALGLVPIAFSLDR
jgi:protein TonB